MLESKARAVHFVGVKVKEQQSHDAVCVDYIDPASRKHHHRTLKLNFQVRLLCVRRHCTERLLLKSSLAAS
jgi:hypothetical protein